MPSLAAAPRPEPLNVPLPSLVIDSRLPERISVLGSFVFLKKDEESSVNSDLAAKWLTDWTRHLNQPPTGHPAVSTTKNSQTTNSSFLTLDVIINHGLV